MKKSPLILGIIIFSLYFGVISVMCILYQGSFFHWDGEWYRSILLNGYKSSVPPLPQMPEHSNVAFFPVYPLLGRLVHKVFGVRAEIALVAVAQLFALGFWYYLQLFLSEICGESGLRLHRKIVLFAIYPYTLYLMVSYSESVFLFFTLGFILFYEKWRMVQVSRERGIWFALCLLHGILMTGTRLVGIAVVAYPILSEALEWISNSNSPGDPRTPNQSKKTILPSVLLSAGSTLGLASFLGYCHWKFGSWNLYFQTVQIGWMSGPRLEYFHHFDKLLIAPWRVLHPHNLDVILSAMVLGFLMKCGVHLLVSWRSERLRLTLLSVGLLLLGMTLYGRAPLSFLGMGRYLLPVFIFVIPLIEWESFLGDKHSRAFRFALVASIALSVAYITLFVRELWVA